MKSLKFSIIGIFVFPALAMAAGDIYLSNGQTVQLRAYETAVIHCGGDAGPQPLPIPAGELCTIKRVEQYGNVYFKVMKGASEIETRSSLDNAIDTLAKLKAAYLCRTDLYSAPLCSVTKVEQYGNVYYYSKIGADVAQISSSLDGAIAVTNLLRKAELCR